MNLTPEKNRDASIPLAIRRSERLHERVQAFAEASHAPPLVHAPFADTFESLALDIARYQFDYSAGFARLVGTETFSITDIDDIPALPTDAFRLARVAVHPRELDRAVYETSGTTSLPGRHPVRDPSTKEKLALLQARHSLFSQQTRGVVVALAPPPTEPPSSSLGHMMELFMHQFDGRRLTPDPTGAAFDAKSESRWLMGTGGLRLSEFHRAAKIALHRSEPLFILSTSFALLAALEELDGARVRTPTKTTVMITGGFKGKKTDVSEEQLREMTCRAFSIEPARIIGEYGMTELGSQLFESPGLRRYIAPPWLRVRAVDAVSRKPVEKGQLGLAHFLDLANIDSCLSVVTQDLIRIHEDGIELCGRAPRAVPRGCSLPYEGLLLGGSP